MRRTVFFVSDGTGITSETLGHALMTQFEKTSYRQRTLPFVDSPEKARSTVEIINETGREDGVRPIVFVTSVNPTCQKILLGCQAFVTDFFSTFIPDMENELAVSSTQSRGRSHAIADGRSYYFRIDAVNFALQHDDGASIHHYEDADLILIGVSRSGKTPTCLYLAMQFGVRAANYPLTSEDGDMSALPTTLRRYRDRLYGLTSLPERLHQIRSERRPGSVYASLKQCRMEVREVEALFRLERIMALNSTYMSVEEIASRILHDRGMERHSF